jgi:hypothetical protein
MGFICSNSVIPDTFDEEFKKKLQDPEFYKEFKHALETDVNVTICLHRTVSFVTNPDIQSRMRA